jgi:hypothetical protein
MTRTLVDRGNDQAAINIKTYQDNFQLLANASTEWRHLMEAVVEGSVAASQPHGLAVAATTQWQ